MLYPVAMTLFVTQWSLVTGSLSQSVSQFSMATFSDQSGKLEMHSSLSPIHGCGPQHLERTLF